MHMRETISQLRTNLRQQCFCLFSSAYFSLVNGIMKEPIFFVRNRPVIGDFEKKLEKLFSDSLFPSGSAAYWESVYRKGGTSGEGSYGRLGEFKAEIINQFVRERQIQSVVELGCGDGNQLSLANYPLYLGLDVSKQAVILCKKQFEADPTKTFRVLSPEIFAVKATAPKADLALSLDVIFHLVEDDVFERYMHQLFGVAQKYVCIYSTNFRDTGRIWNPYVRHRKFTDWVEQFAHGWCLIQHIYNRYPKGCDAGATSNAEFFFYGRDGKRAE
jgi:hypothetical protein